LFNYYAALILYCSGLIGGVQEMQRRQLPAQILVTIVLCALAITALFIAGPSSAAEGDEAEGGGEDLRAATQNPISSLISLPFKFTFDNGADNGNANILSVQPVYPVTVGDWNLVNRLIVPFADAPGGVTGLPGVANPTQGDREQGLGDINYSLFLNPVETMLPFIWGAGASISMPTATDKVLGSEKWSAGPTGVILVQPVWGTYGALARQLWSFAGKSDRDNVNQFLFEPFVNYNLDEGWYLITDMVMTADWEANSDNRWTIPAGGGVGKIFKLGEQPINVRAESYYNVERPNGAPDWTIGFTIQFLFPK
jgi:hypothetical protein